MQTIIPQLLKLVPAPANGAIDGSISAWLIPGPDPAVWLAELATWKIPLHEVQLLVLPSAPANVRPAGVLAILPTSSRDLPSTSAFAQPYVSVVDRLFVPSGSSLRPPMSHAELEQWLIWDVQVAHPTIGLIGCRRGELLRVSDLLSAAPSDVADWSRADPGTVVDPRIHTVKPRSVPAIEDFLRESNDGIGQDTPSVLPPLPQESPLNRASSTALAGGFDAIAGTAKFLAAATGSSSEGWMRRLQEWAAAKREALRDGLEEARAREIARLMRLLESQPDEGLRFALPLRDAPSHRGVAPPGAALSRRDINSDPLFASGPGDTWHVSQEVRENLRRKYRELASRELALGRYRRAAYIFAQLIGEYGSAANALRQGRFFREAAALYSDRLSNPLSAAECLEEGGLLEEAITIFTTLKKYEKVGDLYHRLKDDESAEIAFRYAVNESRSRRDTLSAARILDGKMNKVDEALDVLFAEWPSGLQSAACLKESFRLLGRDGQHDAATQKLAILTDDPSSESHAVTLVNVLAEVTTTYPSIPMRTLAADATRVIAGRRLAGADPAPLPEEVRSLVHAVVRSGLSDRLLAQDGTRYINALIPSKPARPKQSIRPIAKAEATPRSITRVRAFELGSSISWRTAIARPSGIFAQGASDGAIFIARATWDGQLEDVRFSSTANADTPWRLLVRKSIVLAIPLQGNSSERLPSRVWPAARGFPDRLEVTTPDWLPRGMTFDASLDEDDNVWIAYSADGGSNLVVSCFAGDSAKQLLWTRDLGFAVSEEEATTVTVTARAGQIWVTHRQTMTILTRDFLKPTAVLDLPAEIVRVYPSPHHTRPRLGIAFAESACICWPADKRIERAATELVDPAICLTRDGLFVAVGRMSCRAYAIDLTKGELQLQSSSDARETAPIAVTAAPGEGRFAVFYSDGVVQIMKCN